MGCRAIVDIDWIRGQRLQEPQSMQIEHLSASEIEQKAIDTIRAAPMLCLDSDTVWI